MCNVIALTQGGMTPLHYAAKVHALDCVTILLNLNADPMARSRVRINACTVQR
jgi:ankyrin repeat protein